MCTINKPTKFVVVQLVTIEHLIGIDGTLIEEKLVIINSWLAAVLLDMEFLEHS